MAQGHMNPKEFRRFLESNPDILHVELSNYGEMFLNPHLVELLACAWEHQVTVSGGNGVNLNHARRETLEALVKYRVRTLTCSLDGATPETYAKYRVNGNLERVLENIDAIREFRRAHRAAFPLLDWQFVVFGHNEGELEKAREMAARRGMGFLPRLSWDAGYSPLRNPDLIRIATGSGAATREEYRRKRGRGYTREICYQLWRQPVLNWDGRVMGCCVNYWQDFEANAFHDGMGAAVDAPALDYARQMLLGRAEPRKEIPCTRCYHFEEIRETADWLTESEVMAAPGHTLAGAVVPEAAAGVKFAQVSIVEGEDAAPSPESHGRLFRFGVDTAVYFAPRPATRYTAVVRMLGERGWSAPQAWALAVAPRPLCQQWNLNLADPPAAGGSSRKQCPGIPTWIR